LDYKYLFSYSPAIYPNLAMGSLIISTVLSPLIE